MNKQHLEDTIERFDKANFSDKIKIRKQIDDLLDERLKTICLIADDLPNGYYNDYQCRPKKWNPLLSLRKYNDFCARLNTLDENWLNFDGLTGELHFESRISDELLFSYITDFDEGVPVYEYVRIPMEWLVEQDDNNLAISIKREALFEMRWGECDLEDKLAKQQSAREMLQRQLGTE